MSQNKVQLDDELIVKVFDFSDDFLKALGEVCTNKNSRNILMLLAQEELYVNQIAIALDMRVSLVLHHLNKLKELGFLIITSKPISKKTKSHNFYQTNLVAFTVLLRQKETNVIDDNNHKTNLLKRLFKDSVKFVGVSVAGVTSWILTNTINNEHHDQRIMENVFDFHHILFPVLITVMVVGLGIALLYYSKKNK